MTVKSAIEIEDPCLCCRGVGVDPANRAECPKCFGMGMNYGNCGEPEPEDEDEVRQDLDGEQDEADSGLGYDESWHVVEPGDVQPKPEPEPVTQPKLKVHRPQPEANPALAGV